MPEVKKLGFNKNERLCSQKAIGQLFTNGKSVFVFPFRVVYTLNESVGLVPAKVVVSVPKKLFKRAVKRNLIKRRIREAYRKLKPDFYNKIPINHTINVMLIYVSPTLMPYSEIEPKLKSALNILAKQAKANSNTAVYPAD